MSSTDIQQQYPIQNNQTERHAFDSRFLCYFFQPKYDSKFAQNMMQICPK